MTDDQLADLKACDFYGDDFEATLRHTLCNILRVSRGSGRSYQVTRDLQETVGTLKNYNAKHGHDVPALDIQRILNICRPLDKTLSPERQRQEDAIDHILCGALQIIASRWVNDFQRETRGREELEKGIERLVRS